MRFILVGYLQGDVIGILDNSGNLLVKYTYTAYGVPTTSFPGIASSMSASQKQEIYILGSNNPFRYRGYYFDTETGFYYLNSRYYDPVTGRFLNADGYASTGQGVLGQNMFAYCLNNPVNLKDPSGASPICGHDLDAYYCSECGANLILSHYLEPVIAKGYDMSSFYLYDDGYKDFLEKLSFRESTHTSNMVNEHGYMGRYQMGNEALNHIGLKNEYGAWSEFANRFGIYSDDDFLRSESMQLYAVSSYHRVIRNYIELNNMLSYKTYRGVNVTMSGLVAACHLVGMGAMEKALRTGSVAMDGRGTKAWDYLSDLGGFDIWAN